MIATVERYTWYAVTVTESDVVTISLIVKSNMTLKSELEVTEGH